LVRLDGVSRLLRRERDAVHVRPQAAERSHVDARGQADLGRLSPARRPVLWLVFRGLVLGFLRLLLAEHLLRQRPSHPDGVHAAILSGGMAAPPPPLRHVRAAQLRARAIRGAIGRVVLGSVFLVGALAFAHAPDHHNQDSLLWMTGLLLLSTMNVAM